MKYFLFLDDARILGKDISFKHLESNPFLPVITAKNYEDFTNTIIGEGVPELVSFDIDLHVSHYQELTKGNPLYFLKSNIWPRCGFHCAKFLIEYCKNKKVEFPRYYIHSANHVAADYLRKYIEKNKQ